MSRGARLGRERERGGTRRTLFEELLGDEHTPAKMGDKRLRSVAHIGALNDQVKERLELLGSNLGQEMRESGGDFCDAVVLRFLFLRAVACSMQSGGLVRRSGFHSSDGLEAVGQVLCAREA